MGKKNKSISTANDFREKKIREQPTLYMFNFKDIPAEKYTESVKQLFANPDFAEAVEKRNTLVKTAERIPKNTTQMASIINAIQQRDRRLADLVYSVLVQANLHSDVSCDFISFNNLLKYYVDYSKDGIMEKVNTLTGNLDKITFLSDMLESLLVDAKQNMRKVFGDTIEFVQFDTVQQVLTQLRGFFKTARPDDVGRQETQLYINYSDSINEYMGKRLKTYSEKYRKLNPLPRFYTEEDMVEAIHRILDVDKKVARSFIRHTESGGKYIDVTSLIINISEEKAKLIDSLTGDFERSNILNYSFAITTAIMKTYFEDK